MSTAEINSRKKKESPGAWDFFENKLGSPKRFLAPMVNGSELPMRILCKRHGVDLGVTAMIHASVYVTSPDKRLSLFDSCPEDAPVIAQIAGSDPDAFIDCAKIIAATGMAAAIDVNLGCPVKVARKGSYGAFLADDLDLVKTIVTRLVKEVPLPITCKMRLRNEGIESSISYAKMLQDCGISMLTVHGRTKDQVSPKTQPVDWDSIRQIVDALTIPVVANGGIKSLEDEKRCLEVTHAQAVMVGLGLLADPGMFDVSGALPEDKRLKSLALAKEFVDILKTTHVDAHVARGILMKMLLPALVGSPDIHEQLAAAAELCDLEDVLSQLDERLHDPESYAAASADLLPPPWDSPKTNKRVCLSLRQVSEDYKPWREVICHARPPYTKKARKVQELESGGWIMLAGVGSGLLSPETLWSLRTACLSRAWALRQTAVYIDTADQELYNTVSQNKRIMVYYKNLSDNEPDLTRGKERNTTTNSSPPPEKKVKC